MKNCSIQNSPMKADKAVRAFFKGVDVKKYLVAKDVARTDETLVICPSADARADCARAIEQLRETRRNYAFVVGEDGRLQGTVSIDSMLRTLQTGGQALSGALLDDVGAVPDSMSLRDLIGRIVKNPLPLPVVDSTGGYLGAVTQTILLKKMVEEESGHE